MIALAEAPPTFELRWYQEEAVQSAFDWFATENGDPLIVLPTGSGKSAVLSAIMHRARANYPAFRACVLAAQAELVKQNVRAAATFIPRRDIGIYSAGLGEKDASRAVTVANIQSLRKKAYDYAPYDLIIIDECQNIADADSGMYRSFIQAQRLQNPGARILGLTATPFKLSSGMLTEGPHALFRGICYSAPVLRLIDEGYLARPVTPKLPLTLDVSAVKLRGGEFIAKELADAVDIDAITQQAVSEMCVRFSDRKKWLLFAVSIDHARHLAEALTERGIIAAVVHGELPKDERAYRLEAFKRGEIRALASVQLLTVGFDEPSVDAIALLRPTKSVGLYQQMVGRGMRIAPGKVDCLILDFAANIETHGPVDMPMVVAKKSATRDEEGDAVVKVCPACELYQPAGMRECINCGFVFPPPPVVLLAVASTAPILSSDREPTWHTVGVVEYAINTGKTVNGVKKLDTLHVRYKAGLTTLASEFLCIAHTGYARTKAQQWWDKRSPDRCPATLEDALALSSDLRVPTHIATRPQQDNPRYTQVTDYRFADDPTPASTLPKACWSCVHFEPVIKACAHWDCDVPADAQPVGCDAWDDREPELPF